jgi:outer membrane protein TolC
MRLIASTVFFMFALFAQSLYAGSPDSVLYLEDVLEIALQQNPGLQAVQFGARAAEARIPQAGSLPDPQLTLGVLSLPVDSYKFNQEPMTQKVIGISQSIPFFGKLDFKEEIATQESHMLAGQLQQTRLLLLDNVKKTYYRLAYLRNALDVVAKNRILLGDLVEITRTRYAVGKGIQQDILKGQVQLLQEEQRIIELRELYQNASADLNVLLNQLPQQILPDPVQPPVTQIEFDLTTLQETALQNSPILKIYQHSTEQAQAQADLAKRDYWPDFKFSVTYGQREQRPDFLGAMVALNLPLYFGAKQSQRVEETQLLSQNSLLSYHDQKIRLFRDVKNGMDEIDKNQQLINLYQEEIIPHAEQALQSSIAAYQNDKVDFLTVINNQMTLLTQQLKLEQLIRDYHQTIADLELKCGTSLK